MHFPSTHIFEVLSNKEVTQLYHANSIATACQFICSRALLSRGRVERLGLVQTPQKSDEADRRYSIWFDIFLDSVDIHDRASRANVYGPVLFVFDGNIINKNGTGRIWVTKMNPTKWAGKLDKERWFQNKADLEQNFVKGKFDHMIVLRHCGGELPFGKYLKEIILDNPERHFQGVDFYSMAVGTLYLAMQNARISVRIRRRRCDDSCACKNGYRESDDKHLLAMFAPKLANHSSGPPSAAAELIP